MLSLLLPLVPVLLSWVTPLVGGQETLDAAFVGLKWPPEVDGSKVSCPCDPDVWTRSQEYLSLKSLVWDLKSLQQQCEENHSDVANLKGENKQLSERVGRLENDIVELEMAMTSLVSPVPEQSVSDQASATTSAATAPSSTTPRITAPSSVPSSTTHSTTTTCATALHLQPRGTVHVYTELSDKLATLETQLYNQERVNRGQDQEILELQHSLRVQGSRLQESQAACTRNVTRLAALLDEDYLHRQSWQQDLQHLKAKTYKLFTVINVVVGENKHLKRKIRQLNILLKKDENYP